MAGVTLDTGALIAIERGSGRMQARIEAAVADGAELAVPAGVLAQAWRVSPRQARLNRFLRPPEVNVVVDASVVICARVRGTAVVTGDGEDLACLIQHSLSSSCDRSPSLVRASGRAHRRDPKLGNREKLPVPTDYPYV